ncbi:MAG: Gfo/Idh/MocA family oxidoreductase [Acidobacteria bacterium]|nr:Gfo/Idh/MocA family oxidoreductase [Acidobacteriota bacterium]
MRVSVIGGGMIVIDQILPSLDYLRRLGVVSDIEVCARRPSTLEALAAARPDMPFRPRLEPYAQVLAELPPRQLAVIALPDQTHFDAVMTALQADQHVLCVKPLVRTLAESHLIEAEAAKRGLMVAVEYHKRFDDRALMARQRFREGQFGEFRLGTAILFEPWLYRDSNFQNWFTKEETDAFTYIGCHYVDLVAFMTGLKPVSVSVVGIADKFPNGHEGWLWTDARVVWSNGACLNVQNALGYPDHGPGPNTQGLTMWCDRSFLRHSDQYRGLEYCTLDGRYKQPSPDYMQMVETINGGVRPVGYGFRSIEAIAQTVIDLEAGRTTLALVDAQGLIATPSNSRYNEAVVEAGRKSIAQGGVTVACTDLD